MKVLGLMVVLMGVTLGIGLGLLGAAIGVLSAAVGAGLGLVIHFSPILLIVLGIVWLARTPGRDSSSVQTRRQI